MAEEYVRHIERQLRELDARISSAEERLQDGAPEARAETLDALAHMKSRHKALEQRLADAKAQGAENWSDFHASMREDIDALADTFERWLTRTG